VRPLNKRRKKARKKVSKRSKGNKQALGDGKGWKGLRAKPAGNMLGD
jgi:hypothetical protein